MSDTIIRVENLGKKYLIGHQQKGRSQYIALRDVLSNSAKSLWKKIRQPKTTKNNNREEFWALKDVSFEVKQGEAIGIIGRNGAGKSTLLKILSRITEPTTGRVTLGGRVASLLEVGTGFHPELTGRENIYLNGAILGMARAEIKRKFDEIVAFAEVEKFLDTPVKRYSSGMYVRLAFAVAAHLEPEILVVDEVLAVGDAQFQKKCLGKMDDVAKKEGRTVLFVSHNMTAVESLCSRAILLEQGHLHLDSISERTIKAYLDKAYHTTQQQTLDQRIDRSGSGKVRATSFRILNKKKIQEFSLKSGEDYYFEIGYINHSNAVLKNIVVSLDIFDKKDIRLLLLRSNFTNDELFLNIDQGFIYCQVKKFPLAYGTYKFSIFISHRDVEILDYIENVEFVTVDGGDFFGTGSHGLPSHCKFLLSASWSTN